MMEESNKERGRLTPEQFEAVFRFSCQRKRGKIPRDALEFLRLHIGE